VFVENSFLVMVWSARTTSAWETSLIYFTDVLTVPPSKTCVRGKTHSVCWNSDCPCFTVRQQRDVLEN
jgi:hypothetical protein